MITRSAKEIRQQKQLWGEGERGRGGGVLEKFEKGRVSNIGGLYKIGSLEPSSNYA